MLIVLFAAVTFASHFLFPSVRWFLRRRMERVVSRLNERLERPIQPFKLAKRHDMIQRLIYDPKIAEAISHHAREEDVPEAVAFERARRYAREIVPSFSASLYFGFAIKFARWLSRKLYIVHLDDGDDAALRAIDSEATVVFVMNHRSNMDYMLVTYLVADRSALSYAVGEWARVWPLSRVIRAMGAFFIRRKSRNVLYRRVLARYVQLATKGGVTQAVFPEGGLSLDGTVGPSKLGFLSYILSDFDAKTDKDVVFVPVALNYDRVIEDRVLTEAARRGERKFRASVIVGIWFALRYTFRRIIRTAVRFGHAGVGFGAPLSLTEFQREHGRDLEAVGEALRARVRDVVPALPVSTLCYALEQLTGPVSRGDLSLAVAPLIAAHPHPSMADAATTVDEAMGTLLTRRIVTEGPQGVAVNPESRALLEYYARSVAHHFADAAYTVQSQQT
ncbi:Acyltransferase [Candidatus Rhodobacter oscarellae]|uniref:Glycerol-3-phosphate acyltransferase n=1 Tax=Candidatus Rhodobacter oscarellae TaxID=1675527 RepID=A0A0J9E9I8_9RHOB|nr:Acyltransferase [Candidatus Rhodobacter lobularis]